MMFQQARDVVVKTCVELADMGYLAGTGGNLALRVDKDHLLVTPSATDYYAMGPEDICVLRMRDIRKIEGEKVPTVEASLHAKVLSARPDCTASVHTHQPIASAYTLLSNALDVKDAEAAALLGETVPCVSYAPSGTGWLAKRVGNAFTGPNHACLMRSHGIVCVGTDIQQAIQRVVALEAVCAAFFQSTLTSDSGLSDTTTRLIERTLSSTNPEHKQESIA